MRNSAGVADAVEARGGMHERVRLAEPASAPRGASHDGDNAEHAVEIILDVDRVGGKLVAVHTVKELPAGGEDSDATPGQSPSYAHGARRARIQQVSRELRALASSRGQGGGPSRTEALTFVSRADASAGWAAVERRFDEEAKDGLLHRSKLAKCIGTHLSSLHLAVLSN
jgi:respiratory burst oxidase